MIVYEPIPRLHRPVRRKSLPEPKEDERALIGKTAEFLAEHQHDDNLTEKQKALVAQHAEALKAIADVGREEMSPEMKSATLNMLGALGEELDDMRAQLEPRG